MQPAAVPQPQANGLQGSSTSLNGAGYSYTPNGNGGVNYYLNGTPITNTQYGAGTFSDTNGIESKAASDYAASLQPSGASSNTSVGTGAGGYRTPDYAALANAYTANFDAQDQGLQNSMNLNQNIANSGQDRVNSSYGVQKGGLDQQLAFGNSNLDASQSKLDITKANSFRDLGNQLRLAQQGYSNQVGVNGAGDSSAADVINYALSNQGNRAANDISQNVDTQQTGLNLQRNQLQGSFEQNKKMLDDWHATQIQSIINNYAQTQQQLEVARSQAQGQKAIDLAYIGKGQAANQAIAQMQALQASYNGNLNQLQTAYGNIQAPVASIGTDLTNAYTVNPISPSSIALSGFGNNQATTTPTYTTANVKKTSDNNPYAQ